ncbi:MAG: hypothetical protein IPF98_00800 [Gemmatimonadetes bacterium]|nr:hypothetical protein [Gemmatimonadota bacterium]
MSFRHRRSGDGRALGSDRLRLRIVDAQAVGGVSLPALDVLEDRLLVHGQQPPGTQLLCFGGHVLACLLVRASAERLDALDDLRRQPLGKGSAGHEGRAIGQVFTFCESRQYGRSALLVRCQRRANGVRGRLVLDANLLERFVDCLSRRLEIGKRLSQPGKVS